MLCPSPSVAASLEGRVFLDCSRRDRRADERGDPVIPGYSMKTGNVFVIIFLSVKPLESSIFFLPASIMSYWAPM